VESRLAENGRDPAGSSLEEMERFWIEAKEKER
jgi:hypothetical protein